MARRGSVTQVVLLSGLLATVGAACSDRSAPTAADASAGAGTAVSATSPTPTPTTTTTTPTTTTTTPTTTTATTTTATTTTTTTATTTTTTTTPATTSTTAPTPGFSLPLPDGPFAVGVVDVPLANTVAYYPARPDSGVGHRPYIDAVAAAGFGRSPEVLNQIETTALVGAAPASSTERRPVVVLTPGFRSVIALSTSLAEQLASHGFVVIAAQTDVVTETSHQRATDDDRSKRFAQLAGILDGLGDPVLAALVGPLDLARVAVGGHSWAGSIAFNTSLNDTRIAAVFDLDGSLFGAAGTTPPEVPALLLVTLGGPGPDAVLRALTLRSPRMVAVGLVGALHFDVTDAASIAPLLGASPASIGLGSIGPEGTTDTSTIVLRFLEAALSSSPRLATGAELVAGLPAATADPFANAT